eukprot:6699952-Prymnesium_polylepis.1
MASSRVVAQPAQPSSTCNVKLASPRRARCCARTCTCPRPRARRRRARSSSGSRRAAGAPHSHRPWQLAPCSHILEM